MRIPKLRRHTTGQWMVKIEGKCKYLGTKKEEAERKYRELIVEHYGPSHLGINCPSTLTVGELLKGYIKEKLSTCPPQWRQTRTHVFEQMSQPVLLLYSKLPVNDFGPKAYKSVRSAMSAQKSNQNIRRNIRSISYVNLLCSRLKSAFQWGVSEELVDESTYNRLLTVPDLVSGDLGLSDGREVLPVPESLYMATLPYLSETAADFLRLLWLSGCRPGELIRLSPAELVKDGGFMVYRPKSHKTKRKNKLRAIVFGSEGIEILKRYWPADESGRFFAIYSDAAVVRNAVYRACARGKLTRWHPYQLRHAAVTRIALQHGKEVAQAVAGHANVLTTNHYDHGAVERAKRAAG